MGGMGDGMLGFQAFFDIRPNQDGRVVSCTRRPHFTPKEIAWYSFLSEAERPLGIVDADTRLTSLENFQESDRESKPGPPILCCDASTNNFLPLIWNVCRM